MRRLLLIPAVGIAAALLLTGCGASEPASTDETVEETPQGQLPEERSEETTGGDGLGFQAIEALTPDAGFVGHEREPRCIIVAWDSNSTGISAGELRDKNTFFRQMDCYKDDSGFPEFVQVAVYAEFEDEESAGEYAQENLSWGKDVILEGVTVFAVNPDFDQTFTGEVQQLCGCELLAG